MNYGLYLSASGVLTNLYRQDVFANNLANVETTAFKPDTPTVRQRDPEVLEDRMGMRYRHDLLDRLGGGVLPAKQRINFANAPLKQTNAPMDVALTQKNQFFAVRAATGDGQSQIMVTRDGRFTLNAQGELALAGSGAKVLDANDQPIVVPADVNARFNGRGELVDENQQPIAQIQVTLVDDPTQLEKRGDNLFAFKGEDDPRQAVPVASVKPGFLETSGADPIRTLMSLTTASKAVSSNGNMIRYHDLMMDRAVNTLGRVRG